MRHYLLDKTINALAVYAHERKQPVYELKSDRYDIPPDHKCWRCHWATWCGDRFFCPLAFTCVREKLKVEEVVVDGEKAIDRK